MKIYVGKLPRDITERGIRNLFKEYGYVHNVIMLDYHIINHVYSAAYVEMPEEKEALTAIKTLDGILYDGNMISVHKARSRVKDRRKSGRGGGRRSTDFPEEKS
jgi:RNA recognition motif-containing protein